MFDIREMESACYKYFVDKEIKSRQELRECLKKYPINGVQQTFAELLFSNFQKERKSLVVKTTDRKSSKLAVVKTVVISDLHIPYEDPRTVDIVFDYIVDTQPDNLVLDGDIIDCYWSSSFIKQPDNTYYLQEEIDAFYKKFSYLKRHIPNTEVFYILGNHEDRIKRNKKQNPELYGLKSLQPEKLLHLNELGIKCYDRKLTVDGILCVHGERVSSKSSYTAKAECEAHNLKRGISGHTHRLGSYYTSYDGETIYWYENGCLCDVNPEYIKDCVNWQQGFSEIISCDGITQIDQILIDNHKFIRNGVLYK